MLFSSHAHFDSFSFPFFLELLCAIVYEFAPSFTIASDLRCFLAEIEINNTTLATRYDKAPLYFQNSRKGVPPSHLLYYFTRFATVRFPCPLRIKLFQNRHEDESQYNTPNASSICMWYRTCLPVTAYKNCQSLILGSWDDLRKDAGYFPSPHTL